MNEAVVMLPRHRARSAVVRQSAMLATATMLLVLGCDSAPDPIETSEPNVTYEQVDEDLCNRLKADQVAARFGLGLRPSYDRTVRFNAVPDHVYLTCGFWAYDGGERFRTPLGEFDPAGTIRIRTYSDHGAAETDHASEVSSLRSGEQSRPGMSNQAVSGWWDAGIYSQQVRAVDPKDYPRLKGLDAAEVGVIYELRHANLLVTTNLSAVAATPEIEEVLALLRDLANALTTEAVSHLTRTGPD
ncbi:hypothetical protein [Plantactinospora sp. B24E8]|uniref:hypothetical protein n=1 Tax=Plantactinospora sp. B24E8 TaxID=3153567 RepID=UPI00325E1856